MRYFRLTLVVLSAWASLVLAQQPQQPPQQPPPPPPLNPAASKLDEVLVKWELSMNGLTSLVATCVRTKDDKTFQTKEVFEGVIKYLRTKGGSMASLELRKQNRPEVFEKYIISGAFLYEYSPQTREIRIREIPRPAAGQAAEDNLLTLIFPMKPAQAKQRYEMTYVPPPPGDTWYHYIEIKPKLPQDKADFTRARLVLFTSNHLPAQFWFEERNGSEVRWDFRNVAPGVQLNVNEFAQPTLPPGWQFRRMPAEAQPRVMRNQQ